MATTDYRIEIVLCEEDFEERMGRRPKSQEEFNRWCWLVKRGLLDNQMNWDILYDCAREAMTRK